MNIIKDCINNIAVDGSRVKEIIDEDEDILCKMK
jgi:uncharacterized protein YuzB (UPF0349 family)